MALLAVTRWVSCVVALVTALEGRRIAAQPAASSNPSAGTARATATVPGASAPTTTTAAAPQSSETPAPAPRAPSSTDDEEEGEPRLSLPTEEDRAAWQRGGFRFGLGISYGRLSGLDGAPSGTLLGALVRLGLRLDPDWSLLSTLQYQRASGGLVGLRFSGTVDPTWHVTPHLALAFGFGFGGIVEGTTGRADIAPLGDGLATSYTFPGASPPLPSCSGVGVAGLTRAEWSMVLGPRSSTSLMLEGAGQWTGCVADTGNVDNDSGQAIVRRQWWPHLGAQIAWGISWR